MEDLIGRGVLPRECFLFVAGRGVARVDGMSRSGVHRTDGGVGTWRAGYVAPGLVGKRRGLERERVKDRIRAWIESRGRVEVERRVLEREKEGEKSVRTLVKRFTKSGVREEGKWGKPALVRREKARTEPTRAHVLELRRFWEALGRQST